MTTPKQTVQTVKTLDRSEERCSSSIVEEMKDYSNADLRTLRSKEEDWKTRGVDEDSKRMW